MPGSSPRWGLRSGGSRNLIDSPASSTQSSLKRPATAMETGNENATNQSSSSLVTPDLTIVSENGGPSYSPVTPDLIIVSENGGPSSLLVTEDPTIVSENGGPSSLLVTEDPTIVSESGGREKLAKCVKTMILELGEEEVLRTVFTEIKDAKKAKLIEINRLEILEEDVGKIVLAAQITREKLENNVTGVDIGAGDDLCDALRDVLDRIDGGEVTFPAARAGLICHAMLGAYTSKLKMR